MVYQMRLTITLKFLGRLPRMLITIIPENALFVVRESMNMVTVLVEET